MVLLIKRMFALLLAIHLLPACGGDADKTSTTVVTDSITNDAAGDPQASGIVTTAQHMMLVKHRITNYANWKQVYDANDSLRAPNGIRSYVIGRAVNDSNMVFVAVKADDLAKAKAFSRDDRLRTAMRNSGVVGSPAISVITMTWQDTSVQPAPVRSMTTFAVKSWSTWQRVFQEGKQERIDNGIIDRAYGHDVDDSNKVTLVTAIIDSTKAAAYWTSDLLKKRRAASGVIGQPDRFLFTIVQRY